MLPTACLISDVLSSRKPEISVLVVQSPNQAMPTRRKRRHLMAGEQCVRDVFEISFEGINAPWTTVLIKICDFFGYYKARVSWGR